MKRIIASIICVLFFVGANCQCVEKDSLAKLLTQVFYNTKISAQDQRNEYFCYEEMARRCGYQDDSVYVRLLRFIAWNYYIKEKDYLQAVKYYNRAIALFERPGIVVDSTNKVSAYYLLGDSYGHLQDVSSKIKMFNRCIELSVKYHLTSTVSYFRALDGRAKYYFDLGDYHRCSNEAKECERQGLEALKVCKPSDVIHIQGVMSSSAGWYVNAQLMLGNYALLEDYLHAQEQLHKADTNVRKLGVVYSQLGELYARKKNYENAVSFYEASFQCFQRSKDSLRCKQALNELGLDVYFNGLKDNKKALACYRQALRYHDNKEPKPDTAETLNIYTNIANVYVRKGRFDSAFIYFQRAFDQLKKGKAEDYFLQAPIEEKKSYSKIHYLAGLVIDKADAYRQQYKATGNKDTLAQAIRIYKAADRLLNSIKVEQEEIQSKLFWLNNTRSLYEHAIEACDAQQNNNDAFYFFEKSRAVLLNDQLITQDLHIKEKNPLYYQRLLDTNFITLRQMQTMLQTQQQSLVEIFEGDSVVYSLLVTPHSCKLNKIDKTNFTQATELFLRYVSNALLANRDFAGYKAAAHDLYQLIFQNNPPPEGRIIISPDQHYFPFEALVTNAGAHPVYFLDNYAVSYTYSARYLQNEFPTAKSETSGYLLGVAPVHYAASLNLESLDGSDESLHRISSHFGKYNNLLGAAASRNNFLNKFADYSIIQLYTHAAATSSNQEPVIYFADSSLFLSDLILGNRPATRLIVLSACETGAGQVYQGEGVFSFNRGFAALGIPSAVANLWIVSDQSTYRLTELFYEELAKNLPLDVAMQKAKIKFMQTGSADNLPYYWSAAIVVGKTEPVQMSHASSGGMMLMLIIGAGLVLIFVISLAAGRNKRQ